MRPPYSTRQFLLRSKAQIDTLMALIPHLPVDEEKPLEVRIGEATKARGLDANGYYWLRVTEIADQAWFDGKQYHKEIWHEYLKRHVMPNEITTKDGEVRSKWVESPDGSEVIISTTQLERGCFSAYTEAITAFGANLGVQFSANPREVR